ncbi:alkaline phosphatase family protein [Leptolyngbya sp. AN02str]|uniref:alkaline phosphatase family protein n=1 Tax=Leptolyngbya sp. AN02str TaxID=3423363 RepID=UPI003D31BD22
MKHPVIAIGLDSADPVVLEQWMAQGHLKNLNRIRQAGAYGRLRSTAYYAGGQDDFSSTEPLWAQFNTGCLAHKTGFWDTVRYDPTTYGVRCDAFHGGYNYCEYDLFYALGQDYKVAAFDVPVSTISQNVNGLQVLGWGGHHPFVPSVSEPAGLLPEILGKYGENPVLRRDNGRWWDESYKGWLLNAIAGSLSARVSIIKDLLKRDRWDLFVTGMGETHSAAHDLYDRSQPDHLLHQHFSQQGGTNPDPMLQAYENVDAALGEILDAAPDGAYVMVFSLHGIAANNTDQLSMFFLAEMLYRMNFPGKMALAPGKAGTPPPPPITKPIRRSWPGEIWRKIYEPNPIKRFLNNWVPKQFLQKGQHGLLSPYPLMEDGTELGWMPAYLYRPLWPTMKAFAIPAFSDGQVRINLKGREAEGIVDPSEYDALCDQITEMLYGWVDGRTGQRLVKNIIRTRTNPLDTDPKLCHADLVVVWNPIPTDVVDHPTLGRIGPITLNRPGAHRARGFVMAQGPGIEPGTHLDEGSAVDLAPTILNLMGAPLPDYLDGEPLLRPTAAPVV